MTSHSDVSTVRHNVEYIRSQILNAGGAKVSLVAVTKSLTAAAMIAARDAGCDAVGENYAQELRDKVAGLDISIPIHFIGAIQTNKVRLVASVVDVWQSVDRSSVIDEIARRSSKPAQILIQVNTTGEDAKSGCQPADVESLMNHAANMNVVVLGLMTMGPTSQDPQASRQSFRTLRDLVDTWGLSVCSMGMSGDFQIAVEEGSTMVRIGQSIFGPRT
jgi:pyridoxal phosphate enzyme (YggS family)